MDSQDLVNKLKITFEDFRLSTNEKYALKDVLSPFVTDAANRAFIRNRAFDIVTEHIGESGQHRIEAMGWLRQIVKLLDGLEPEADTHSEQAWFSPGPDCASQIKSSIGNARKNIDVCVFTISDNDISEQLHKAHHRGVKVRIITDDEKTRDVGSDIHTLHRAGIPVKTDNDPAHMHHKFAIFDKQTVLNGSFNWTRSASTRNHEDITLTNHPNTVKQFCERFEALCQQFVVFND